MSIEEKQMQIVTLEEKLLSLDMNTEEFTAIKKELKALKQ